MRGACRDGPASARQGVPTGARGSAGWPATNRKAAAGREAVAGRSRDDRGSAGRGYHGSGRADCDGSPRVLDDYGDAGVCGR